MDRVPRIDYRRMPKSEFIEKYEAKNLPVVITHATDNWRANAYWNDQVRTWNQFIWSLLLTERRSFFEKDMARTCSSVEKTMMRTMYI